MIQLYEEFSANKQEIKDASLSAIAKTIQRRCEYKMIRQAIL